MPNGPSDEVTEWANLDSATRKAQKAKYNAAGIKVIVSAFGEESHATTEGLDATVTAKKMAEFVKNYHLDGIDIDYEDFDAIDNAGVNV